jgi:hypothetical protein
MCLPGWEVISWEVRMVASGNLASTVSGSEPTMLYTQVDHDMRGFSVKKSPRPAPCNHPRTATWLMTRAHSNAVHVCSAMTTGLILIEKKQRPYTLHADHVQMLSGRR